MIISAETHALVMRAATKLFWQCPCWHVQRMLLAESTRRFRVLQAMGVIDPRAHLSRRIPR